MRPGHRFPCLSGAPLFNSTGSDAKVDLRCYLQAAREVLLWKLEGLGIGWVVVARRGGCPVVPFVRSDHRRAAQLTLAARGTLVHVLDNSIVSIRQVLSEIGLSNELFVWPGVPERHAIRERLPGSDLDSG
jgi:hypothetical protein